MGISTVLKGSPAVSIQKPDIVVEISFDKVVSHLFSDSMSLVTHEAAPWLASSGEILEI